MLEVDPPKPSKDSPPGSSRHGSRALQASSQDNSSLDAANPSAVPTSAGSSSAENATATVDGHGKLTSWSANLVTLTGWPATEAIGKSLSDLVVVLGKHAEPEGLPRNTPAGLVSVRGYAEATPRALSLTTQSLTNGELLATFSPLANLAPPADLAADTTSIDLDSQRLGVFLGQHACFCYTVNPELVFTTSKGSGLKSLNMQDGQAIGLCLTDLWGTREPGYEPLACHFRALAGEQQTYQDVCMDRALEYQLAPLQNSAGQTVGVIGIGFDVTERERLKAENRTLAAQLRHAQKMEVVGQLAGGVAHDFNNLLTCIMGNISLALNSVESDSEVASYLAEADVAVESAARLTHQLLAFSRKQVIAPRPLNLSHLVVRTAGMLQKLLGSSIELRIRCSEDLRSVQADPGQLEQVLVNLVLNARDAIANGGEVTVLTENLAPEDVPPALAEQVTSSGAVVLTVSDTGCGMAEWIRARLFEPFFTTKPQGEGTGLGLATVYGAVQQNGGAIEVDSELGKGTRFRILLPAIEAQAPDLDYPALRSDSRALQYAPRGTETVLLVEDEPLLLDLARCALEDAGYQVLACPSADEALRVFAKTQRDVHVLVTDVIMPRMNGKDLAARILAFRPELPVLFTSGYGENIIATHGVIDAGISFMSKPYRPADLVTKVRAVLDGQGPESG